MRGIKISFDNVDVSFALHRPFEGNLRLYNAFVFQKPTLLSGTIALCEKCSLRNEMCIWGGRVASQLNISIGGPGVS